MRALRARLAECNLRSPWPHRLKPSLSQGLSPMNQQQIEVLLDLVNGFSAEDLRENDYAILRTFLAVAASYPNVTL